MKIVSTESAPAAIGPYSQAIILEQHKLIYTAGQLGIVPGTGQLKGDIKSQTRQALENIKSVLNAAGSDLAKTFKTTIYLKNMDDFADMNSIYGEYFPNNPPARSAVQVARLPKDALVEIEAIAQL